MRRPDFVCCYEKGKRYHSENFILFALQKSDLEEGWRFGLAVGRKCGNAVQRNRIKRVLREFFRLNQKIVPSFADIAVVARRHINLELVSLNSVSTELLPIIIRLGKSSE